MMFNIYNTLTFFGQVLALLHGSFAGGSSSLISSLLLYKSDVKLRTKLLLTIISIDFIDITAKNFLRLPISQKKCIEMSRFVILALT
jgi:hypothetical protein